MQSGGMLWRRWGLERSVCGYDTMLLYDVSWRGVAGLAGFCLGVGWLGFSDQVLSLRRRSEIPGSKVGLLQLVRVQITYLLPLAGTCILETSHRHTQHGT